MRYIFVDEAGTSQHEPVTVVVGIIADADRDVMSAERLVAECLGGVPERLRPDFVFHASEVFGGHGEYWSGTDRIAMLEAMMSIPARIGMPVTLSAFWRNSVTYPPEILAEMAITQWQYEHLLAFTNCLAVADRNIRRHAGPSEVATVVAEDVPEMRKHLKLVPRIGKHMAYVQEPSGLRKTSSDAETGYCTQSGDMRIVRIRNAVHFVEKADDPLVQVADACAFGFRRYFANQSMGEKFVHAILGDVTRLRDFAPPAGAACYWFDARRDGAG